MADENLDACFRLSNTKIKQTLTQQSKAKNNKLLWFGISLMCYVSRLRHDDGVVRASASQSVDLGFIPHVDSHQKTLKNGIYSFPACRSEFIGGCGEQAGKFACVLGQGT